MYAEPGQSGLLSTDRACAAVIRKLLDALAAPAHRFQAVNMPEAVFDHPNNAGRSFENDCWAFRVKLIERLKEEYNIGYRGSHRLLVSKKKGSKV